LIIGPGNGLLLFEMLMPKPKDSNPPPVVGSAPEAPSRFGGAVGAGIVLVLLPSAALYFGIGRLDDRPGTGLAIVALFGTIVLVGALAMTTTLFKRLGLTRRSEPLALPPGSVRATIALALIVLFAIIAAAVLHPAYVVVELKGLTAEAKADIERDAKVQVLASAAEACAATLPASAPFSMLEVPGWKPAAPACASSDQRYTVKVRQGPDAASQDLAKQLLQMIGGLMATTVGFYFASRTSAPKTLDPTAPPPVSSPDAGPSPKPDDVPSAPGHGEHVDGCNVAVEHPTEDHELPAARGGVVPK
jgi:hypothetical protein